jgi:hypothetical protein
MSTDFFAVHFVIVNNSMVDPIQAGVRFYAAFRSFGGKLLLLRKNHLNRKDLRKKGTDLPSLFPRYDQYPPAAIHPGRLCPDGSRAAWSEIA